MPDPVASPQPPDQTVDHEPSAPPSQGGPSTARQQETSFRTDDKTGAYVPSDASSVTGGYTPSDIEVVETKDVTVAGFEILDELGRGGMGVVYKARQVALNRVVALKMILSGAHARPKDLERFRAEALAVARFQHPGIVQIYEVGESDGLPYFSLEFVAGGTLSKKISRDPQPPKYAAEIVESLARAMHYAHERGIIHRDLKPANILLAEDGTPKITDFGLAKTLEADSGQTQAGTVLGTPSYMAPEQANGEEVGPLADVYSLGGILYDLLTGRPPFSGSSVLDTLEMVRKREPVPPSQLAGRLPKDIETIALKCLQKDPSRRYANALELAEDLRRFQQGLPILARPISSLEKGWRWAKRNPGLAGMGVTVAALLITVALVTSILSFQAERARKNEELAKNDAIENEKKAEKARADEEIAKGKAIEEQKKAEASRQIAIVQRTHAVDTIRGVLNDVDSQMRNSKKLAPLRRKIVDKMLLDLDKIRNTALEVNPYETRLEASAYARIGDIYFRANRFQDAKLWQTKAKEIQEALEKTAPKDQMLVTLFNLSGITHQLADTEWRLGNNKRSRELHHDALQIRIRRQKLAVEMKEQKAMVNVDYLVADSYGLVAFADLRLGDPASAIKFYDLSDKGFAALPENVRASLDVRRKRAEIQLRLGDAHARLNDLTKAKKHTAAALAERQVLVKLTPTAPYSLLVQADLAQTRMYVGDHYLMFENDPVRADAEYQQALAGFSKLVKNEDDENLDMMQRVASVQYRLGVLAGARPLAALVISPVGDLAPRASHFAESLKFRQDLAKIDPKDAEAIVELLLIQARLGLTKDAEENVKKLVALSPTEPSVLFQAACGYAILGGGPSENARKYRQLSLDTIERLIESGWKDAVSLKTDPDLENVRNEKRLTTLLEKIEAKPMKDTK